MPPRARTLVLAALLGLMSTPARAQDEAPGDSAVHGFARQQLIALLNPMGAEHQLEVGLRARLGDPRELLFTGTHVEAGGISYVSPVYAIHGGYLQVSPLAFLALRAEFTGTAMWPIGMSGAGYYGLDSYDAPVRSQDLLAEDADTATGWNVRLMARLQGAIPLGDGAQLVLANQMAFEHDTLGGSPYYYSMKHDLVMARQDWVLTNDGIALAEIPIASDVTFHGGAYSNLRWIPRSGYVGHQVGPLVAVSFERPIDSIGSISLFVRGGYYTHHVTRQDELTILGGVEVDYDLGGL